MLKDLTDMRFGRLKVINRVKNTIGTSGQRSAKWLCKCDCGNETVVRSDALRSGHTKSCGCLLQEQAKDKAKKMGLESRKHFGCLYCGSDKHYAKGFCKNCYNKSRRGTLE